MMQELESGNENQWEIKTLAFVLLNPDLGLVEDESSTTFDVHKEIELLRNIEISFLANRSSMNCLSDEYKDIVRKLKSVATNVLYKDALQEINDIDNSPMERKVKLKLRQLQDKEKNRKKEGGQSIEHLKGSYAISSSCFISQFALRSLQSVCFEEIYYILISRISSLI